MAIANLPAKAGLTSLVDFRNRLVGAIMGKLVRPPVEELAEFGRSLFAFCIRDDIERLYARLPDAPVRLCLFSNVPELQALPWEYIQEPDQPPGPRRDRSVVRLVPTIGYSRLEPLPFEEHVHVLFVSADPVDQEVVSWTDLKETIERTFAARIPDRFELEAVAGTTRESLVQAINDRPCDIFHFSGHGQIIDGMGQLVLVDPRNENSSPIRADELASVLRGKGIRLVVLSACETSSGDFADDFAVTALTLVKAGIPAVVANQLPVPDSTVATFVGAMYDTLLQSGDIDLAVSEARVALAINLASATGAPLEWGIPTLYRHIAGGTVFGT